MGPNPFTTFSRYYQPLYSSLAFSLPLSRYLSLSSFIVASSHVYARTRKKREDLVQQRLYQHAVALHPSP